MAVTGGPSKYNVELNVVPFIDILSTCICFLLMTTVWLQVGSFNMSQATGAPTEESTKQKPTLHLRIDKDQDLVLVFKEFPAGKIPRNMTLASARGQLDLNQLEAQTAGIQSQFAPIETVLIEPQQGVTYEQIVHVVSVLKKNGMKSIGLMPLSNQIAGAEKAAPRKSNRRGGVQ